MIFEDINLAAEAFEIAHDYMERTWIDENDKPYRPRREDIVHILGSMRDSLLRDQGQHDYIKTHGLMVDLTDNGTIVYRLEPDLEHVYRLMHSNCGGAPFHEFGSDEDDSFLS